MNCFVRNDDVGALTERLKRLIDIFVHKQCFLNLAVVPKWLTEETVAYCCQPEIASWIRISQHGFTHRNHSQQEGLGDEFPDYRPLGEMVQEILAGKTVLDQAFPKQFTHGYAPPWNTRTKRLTSVLKQNNYAYISAYKSPQAGFWKKRFDQVASLCSLNKTNFKQYPVAVDYMQNWGQDNFSAKPLGLIKEELEAAAKWINPVGLMLHHEHMTNKDFDQLEQLLSWLKQNNHCLIEV